MVETVSRFRRRTRGVCGRLLYTSTSEVRTKKKKNKMIGIFHFVRGVFYVVFFLVRSIFPRGGEGAGFFIIFLPVTKSERSGSDNYQDGITSLARPSERIFY